MAKSLRTLLSASIDYAGLFPPAQLDMPTTVRNFAQYRASADHWLLGRLVIPASRLIECEAAIHDASPNIDPAHPWQISVLIGMDLQADLALVRAFNQRRRDHGLVIDTLELKAVTADAITHALQALDQSCAVYVEIPINHDPQSLITCLAQHNARAKVRTGGVTPDLFPSATDLVHFTTLCVEHNVPFKATAGLHHPLRATHSLTYAPDSPTAPMFGFLNLFLAVAGTLGDLNPDQIALIVQETSPDAIPIDDSGISWRDHHFDLATIAATRRLVVAFGSCSFEEPVNDLKAMKLL